MRATWLGRLTGRIRSLAVVPTTECTVRDLHVGSVASRGVLAEKGTKLPWCTELGSSLAPSNVTAAKVCEAGSKNAPFAPLAQWYRGAHGHGMTEFGRGVGAFKDLKGINHGLDALRRAGLTQRISRTFTSVTSEQPGERGSASTTF